MDVNGSNDSENINKVIVVNQKAVEKVLIQWNKIHTGKPTDKELDKLLKDYMQDEILYREALLRNLDMDDEGIKQILVDKLKYTMSDSLNISEVSLEVLKEYFNANKDNFTEESEINLTFGQLYLNPQEHTAIDLVAKKLLKNIESLPYSQKMSEKGDKFYAGSYFNNLTKKELSHSFSRSFVNELIKLPKGQWSILKSGFGVHLIYMLEMHKQKVKFEDIKERVKDTYIIEKNRDAYKIFYEKIKNQYKIIIDSTKNGTSE